MEIAGRAALVTGGAVRVGRRICERLAAAGCRVAVHYRRSAAEAAQLAGELRRSGVEAWAVEGSLESEAGCRELLAKAWEATGGLDFLVNNASAFHRHGLAEADGERLEAELRINLFAPLHLIRALAARAAAGRVVNLLDRRVAGVEAGCLPYLLSKKGLADLTRIAALELAPRFTVNGVAPGPVLNPVGGGGRPDRAGRIPLERRPTLDQVADAVLFLLAADSVTGQVLYVDGGQHLLGGEVRGG